MIQETLRVRDSRLFTYQVGSADMWFVAVNERTLFLRNDPEAGPVIRGELCELGPDCHANLSQVLLEYAMSCEEWRDPAKVDELVMCTFDRVGRILAKRLYQDAPDLSVEARVRGALEVVLRSMGCQPEIEQTVDTFRFGFACCPLLETAYTTGFARAIVAARRGFLALVGGLVSTLAPDWTIVSPTASQAEEPWTELVLHCREDVATVN